MNDADAAAGHSQLTATVRTAEHRRTVLAVLAVAVLIMFAAASIVSSLNSRHEVNQVHRQLDQSLVLLEGFSAASSCRAGLAQAEGTAAARYLAALGEAIAVAIDPAAGETALQDELDDLAPALATLVEASNRRERQDELCPDPS